MCAPPGAACRLRPHEARHRHLRLSCTGLGPQVSQPFILCLGLKQKFLFTVTLKNVSDLDFSFSLCKKTPGKHCTLTVLCHFTIFKIFFCEKRIFPQTFLTKTPWAKKTITT